MEQYGKKQLAEVSEVGYSSEKAVVPLMIIGSTYIGMSFSILLIHKF